MGTDIVFLGIRTNPDEYQRIKLENVDLEDKVSEFKKTAAIKANLLTQNVEFVYCGVILDDTSSLSACGVQPGVTIHIIEKAKPETPKQDPVLTEIHVQRLVVAFRTFTLSAGYRNALQRLSRPSVLEKIIAATPGLVDDPVAISIIRDPELIVQLSDPDIVRRVVELHPTLVLAANHIAAYIHKEAGNLNQSNTAGTSSGYSYSLEALSDDDDDDSMESADDIRYLTRNRNAITTDQLAAAIANASNSSSGSSNPPATTTAATPTTGGNIITTEMFRSAVLNAIAGGSATTPTNSSSRGVVETNYRQMQSQLDQMRELGLVNNSVNLRALQTTSGDVQAAVELVLSGAFD